MASPELILDLSPDSKSVHIVLLNDGPLIVNDLSDIYHSWILGAIIVPDPDLLRECSWTC
jgi:hypothetical protein